MSPTLFRSLSGPRSNCCRRKGTPKESPRSEIDFGETSALTQETLTHALHVRKGIQIQFFETATVIEEIVRDPLEGSQWRSHSCHELVLDVALMCSGPSFTPPLVPPMWYVRSPLASWRLDTTPTTPATAHSCMIHPCRYVGVP